MSPSQGVHEAGGPSSEYYHLERLVELVVSPYLGNVLHNRGQLQSGEPPPPHPPPKKDLPSDFPIGRHSLCCLDPPPSEESACPSVLPSESVQLVPRVVNHVILLSPATLCVRRLILTLIPAWSPETVQQP